MKKFIISLLLLVGGLTISASAQSLYPHQFRFQGYVATADGTKTVGTDYVTLTYTSDQFSMTVLEKEQSRFSGAIMYREKGFCSDFYASNDPTTRGWMLQRFIVSGGLDIGRQHVPMVFEVHLIYKDSVSLERNQTPIMAILTAGEYELRTMQFIAREVAQ